LGSSTFPVVLPFEPDEWQGSGSIDEAMSLSQVVLDGRFLFKENLVYVFSKHVVPNPLHCAEGSFTTAIVSGLTLL